MKIEIEVSNPYVYYSKSTKKWWVNINIITENKRIVKNFTSTKLNRAKMKFFKYLICDAGIIGEDIISRLRNKTMRFVYYENVDE